MTPACHAKNARQECSVSSQITLENRNTGFIQLIFQGKRTTPRPALRKPRMTRDGAPSSLAPEQQTRAEQRRGHKRKPCTDLPPNITQEGPVHTSSQTSLAHGLLSLFTWIVTFIYSDDFLKCFSYSRFLPLLSFLRYTPPQLPPHPSVCNASVRAAVCTRG